MLERFVPVCLPGMRPKGGTHEVNVVRVWTDDVDGFMHAVRSLMP